MNERKNFKLIRVGTAIPKVQVADVKYNVTQIKKLMNESYLEGVNITVFPELCVTGYTCGDLFHQDSLLCAEKAGIDELIEYSLNFGSSVFIIGATSEENSRLINAAYVIQHGKLLGIVGKRNLPGYKEFYEPRWFSKSVSNLVVFKSEDFNFGIEICEDVWAPIPPSSYLVQAGADIIFNLSASNDLVGKDQYLSALLKQQSARFICGYVYSSAGYGESTQDLVYSGKGFIYENGKLLERTEFFDTNEQLVFSDIDVESIRNDRRVNNTFRNFLESAGTKVDIIDVNLPILAEHNCHLSDTVREYNGNPFVPEKNAESTYESILAMQSLALAKRLKHTGMKAILGVSGGSDSTWALLVIVEAMKKLKRPMTDIIGVTMPGFATSQRTKGNSLRLMELLGIDSREIDIKAMCAAELKSLGHDLETQDITYENVQARSRTQILMNLSNQEGALVIGTGDLSEAALGWCTYNADHMSMYNVNCSIPKTLIKKLIGYYSQNCCTDSQEIGEVLHDILSTPVSPELTGSGAEGEKAQVTEDKIGPYELHDFFLYNLVRHNFSSDKILFLAEHANFEKQYGKEVIKKWYNIFIKRFFSQQFKRSCVPDGPKVGSVSLSPRGDWRMPSDAVVKDWLL